MFWISLIKKESIPTILEQDRKQKVGRLGNRTGRRNASSNLKNGFLVEWLLVKCLPLMPVLF